MPFKPIARIALIAVLLFTATAGAYAAEAAVNIDVPGERWKTIRLKNLPRGASVALEIISSDKIRVIIVDSVELKRFPKTRALFEASVDQKLGFSVIIPRTGDYYVILDNRTAAQARQVRVRVKAEAPKRRQNNPDSQEKLDKT